MRTTASGTTAVTQTDHDASGAAWAHIPALDGLRGVAVVAVLLFHGGVRWARGGFLGVDAFFVLSGFLITSLLLFEIRGTGGVGLAHFWSRRARRLLPALLAVIAVTGAAAGLVASGDGLGRLRDDALAALAYVANWRFIASGASYFESTAPPSALRHTWSLAIEEQFYLVWPLVMSAVALARPGRRWAWTAAIAGGGALLSIVAMAALYDPGNTTRAYYGTDTRAQVVLIGALLAALVALRERRPVTGAARWTLAAAAAAGAAGFVAAVVAFRGSEAILYRGGLTAVALGVAAVLAHAVLVPQGLSALVLSVAPLRAVGRVSYGLYLWHWPIFLAMTSTRTGLTGPALLAARVAVTAAVSVASYLWLELPFRRGFAPHWRAGVLVPIGVGIAVVAVLLGTFVPIAGQDTSRVAAATSDNQLPLPVRPPRAVGSPAKVLVVGDSVVETMARDLLKDRSAKKAGLEIVNKGTLGCGVVRGGPFRYFGDQKPALPICQKWPEQWTDHITKVNPDVVFTILGRWEVMDRLRNGAWTHIGQPAFDTYIESELELAIKVLTRGGAIVAIGNAPYYFRGERPDGGRWPEDDPARVDRFNAILRKVVSRHTDRSFIIDINKQTSRNNRYTPVIDGVSLRFDGVHFSPAGVRWLEPWLLPQLVNVAPAPTAPPTTRGTSTTLTPVPTGPTVPPPTRPPRTTAPPTVPPETTTTFEEPPPTTSITEPPTTDPTLVP